MLHTNTAVEDEHLYYALLQSALVMMPRLPTSSTVQRVDDIIYSRNGYPADPGPEFIMQADTLG